MLLNTDLMLGVTGNTKARKVIARKIDREFERNKIQGELIGKRKRYFRTSECNQILNGDRLRRYLLKELYKSEELLLEFEQHQKAAQPIVDSSVDRPPQQRPTPKPLPEEAQQQIERSTADIKFHKKSQNQKRQEEGINQAYEAAFSKAKQLCLLDALNRLTLDRLTVMVELDEESLGLDVWNSFVEDDVFPETYDFAAALC